MDYQQLVIQKRQNERLLAKAKDDQKWDLNLRQSPILQIH